MFRCRPVSLVVTLLSVCLFSATLRALPPDVVQHCENATAIVFEGQPQVARALGCAFCVSKSGLFVTAGPVVTSDNQNLQLILNAGHSDQRAIEAKVVRRDPEHDLALIQASGKEDFNPVELASNKLYETMDVAVFAYPYPNGFVRSGTVPSSIVVKLGHVTSLVRKDDQLSQILIDTPLSRGMIGGLVADEKGHAIGVIASDMGYSGRDTRVIPLDVIRAVLFAPQITLKTPALSWEKRHQEQELVLGIVPPIEPAPEYDVELTIRAGEGEPRTMQSHASNGKAAFSFVPLQEESQNAVPMTVLFKHGMVRGLAENVSFQLGDQSLKLEAIRKLHRQKDSSDWEAVLARGQTLTGKLTGLEKVTVNLGDATAKLNLAKACCVTTEAPEGPVRFLGYRVAVKANGQLVGQQSGTIDFTGAPSAPASDSLEKAGPRINISGGGIPAPGKAIHTPILGGPGGNPMEIRSPDNRDVIGFRWQMADWANRPIVRTFEPIYERPETPAADMVLAKPGYVVGGILVDSDLYTHAIRVIFMRQENGRLIPQDNYLSGWIGQPVSGQLPKQLAAHGEHVVGVCGRKGLNMDAIGLVIVP